MTIDEIQRDYSTSPATSYRDIKALILHGEAVKIPHGIKLAATAPFPAPAEGICAFCGGSINDRSIFIIQLRDGSQLKACCAHCGIMALGNVDAATALTCDFLYGRMVNARQAAFLLESSVSLCCQPSVLAFTNPSDAEHFQAGFGGKLCSLDEAARSLNNFNDYLIKVHYY